MIKRFWAVWRSTGGSAPSKRYATIDDAIKEAGRLSNKSGEMYYVLKTIGMVKPRPTPIAFNEKTENTNNPAIIGD